MTPEHSALWQRIAAFELDEAGAEHPFSARLADEQGWSLAHARRVIGEYKRFVFLALVSGHPVTPSKAVDEAWHLHLIYTRSYWGEFCPKILGRPFHHEPSRGGGADASKFAEQYRQTCASYARWFGEEPPAEIWPRDTAKPKRVPSGARRAWLPLAVISAGLGGCASTMIAASLGPLDYTGPDFLDFFAGFALVVFALAGALRWWLRGTVGRFGARMDTSDPYAVAVLIGVDQALSVALTALSAKNLVHAEAAKQALKADGNISADAPAVERKIHARASGAGNPGIVELRRTTEAALDPLIRQMQEAGWLLTEAAKWKAQLGPFLVALLVPALALVKIGIGLHRDRPVGFLVFGGFITAVAAFFFLKAPWRTRAGDAELARLRREYDKLKFRGRVDGPLATPPGLGVALFGAATIAPHVVLLTRQISPPSSSGSDGVSGGSSCGGGGGGGGGGGCGGCGGGGH